MTGSHDARRGNRALAALGFDPNSVFVRDPGVLLDPHFLGAMHAELEAELGGAEAATTLVQVGLIQGLYDAWRVVGEDTPAGAAMAPPLAIRFRTRANGVPSGSIELVGSWPERVEANARLDLVGTCSDVACHLSAGYTSGWLSGTMDADILALEHTCAAAGASECCFVAREVEVWRAQGDPRALDLLADLPFQAIRELVQSQAPGKPLADRGDSRASVVHIWDSVMVIPFTNADEVLRAVDLIGFDPAARSVSVVVVDLAHAVLDEGTDALALEQILAAAEAHGAETILAAVSPLSETVVAELDRQPLWTHKDLPQAIAAAFQIAWAQRNLV